MNRKIILIGLFLSILVLSTPAIAEEVNQSNQEDSRAVNVPILGEINASTYSLFFLTLLISFIDGLNPCSLWILTFLIGIVLYAGKKKIIIVGLTFLIVTATIYGLFIAGALSVFTYVSHLAWIRFLVAGIAFIFAAVSIKDFFWYKKGISFTISDKYKPGIYSKIRDIMKKEGEISTILVTAVMAAGVALVELPCTAGLPMIWGNIVAARGLSALGYISLIVLYVLIYLSIEMIIFFFAVWRMKKIEFTKKKGRILKLVGGSIMLMLGLIMIIDYTLMESIKWTFVLFAVTISIALLIAKVYSKLGKFDEDDKNDRK